MEAREPSLLPSAAQTVDAAPEEPTFIHTEGVVRVSKRPDGRRHVSVHPRPGLSMRHRSWTTSYPLPLIRELYAAKGLYVCDEIMREEDPRYIESWIRHEMLSYLDAAEFVGKRILDFGCGSGASTLVLEKLLPKCEIVAVELEPKLLRVAQLRAAHLGRVGPRFMLSPAPDELPVDVGMFDFVVFSAVFEHLLPRERPILLPRVWHHLKPGGILFLNQTPYRYSPIEVHTTHLPLVNYLPDEMAFRFARRFSKRLTGDPDWETLLRRGIRGATVGEILDILAKHGKPELLEPLPRVGDRIDLWYAKLSPRMRWFKKSLWLAMKTMKKLTGIELVPTLSLAIRKACGPIG
jgi:SAM-dependent methyltransferase